MKKMIVVAMAAVLSLSVAGCAKQANPDQSSAAESTVAESKEAESGASKAESGAAESESGSKAEVSGAAKVLSYEEYMAADLDSQVTVQTYVQAKQAWAEDKATVYTQDRDGAYFVYNMECSQEDYEKLVPGVKIMVTGYKSEWSGEVEIMDATFTFADGSDTYTAPALDVTDLLGTEELMDHQNQFVTFTGMTVEAAGQDADGKDVAYLYNWDGSGTDGDDLYFNVSYQDQTYTFVVESNLCGKDTDVYTAVKNLQIGQKVDLQGYLYWYEGANPHITSVTVVE